MPPPERQTLPEALPVEETDAQSRRLVVAAGALQFLAELWLLPGIFYTPAIACTLPWAVTSISVIRTMRWTVWTSKVVRAPLVVLGAYGRRMGRLRRHRRSSPRWSSLAIEPDVRREDSWIERIVSQ
jgi:hypothetical protein